MTDTGIPEDALLALQRLGASRRRLDQALRARSSGGGLAGLSGLSGLTGLLQLGSQAQQLPKSLAPWVREHPLPALALGAGAGVSLYLAREPLRRAAQRQSLRWWRLARLLLLHQALDPERLIGLFQQLAGMAGDKPAEANKTAAP